MELILNNRCSVNEVDLKLEPFGTKIPYHSAEVSWPNTDKLHDMNLKNVDNISKKFEDLMRVPQVETTIKKTEVRLK